jgi:hypothetical protein
MHILVGIRRPASWYVESCSVERLSNFFFICIPSTVITPKKDILVVVISSVPAAMPNSEGG